MTRTTPASSRASASRSPTAAWRCSLASERPARSSAGGVATVPGDGVTEIGGIGVLESHRRRGIAAAITAGLTRAAHAAGTTTVWLTPGDDGAHRVYARAGFTDTTCQVHLSRPS